MMVEAVVDDGDVIVVVDIGKRKRKSSCRSNRYSVTLEPV